MKLRQNSSLGLDLPNEAAERGNEVLSTSNN